MVKIKIKRLAVIRNKSFFSSIIVIVTGILAIGVYLGSLQHRRKCEEECIRWLKDHKVTGDSFLAFDPLRETDKLIWTDKYLEYFTGADLSDSTIRDDDLHYILMLPNLSSLYLNTDTTKLSANGLKLFETLRKIKTIQINGKAAIPNGWVKSFAAMPNITFYSIDAPVTDESLKILAEHRSQINFLSLGNAIAITDKGMEAIGNLRHLKTLVIGKTNAITGKGFEAIGNLQELESFQFSGTTPIIDNQIRQTLRCGNLKCLTLFALRTDMELSEQTAKDLASLPRLDELTLESNTTPSKSFLAALGRKPWKYIFVGDPNLTIKAEKEQRNAVELSQEEIQQAAADESSNNKKEKTGDEKTRSDTPPK